METSIALSQPVIAEKDSAGVELRVKVLRTLEELEDIRSFWDSWNAHPNSDLDFYSMILRGMQSATPCVFVCSEHDQPQAILVGRIENSVLETKIGYKTLSRLPVRQLTLIHGGAFGSLSARNCNVLIRSVIQVLKTGEADVAFFNHLRADSELCTAARRLPRILSRDFAHHSAVHRGMTGPMSSDDLYQRLSPKVRKNLRWQARKLVKDIGSDVEVRTFSSPGEIPLLIESVEKIAEKTYQRSLAVGFKDDDLTRERLRFEAENGWLRGSVLFLAGKPAAFWIGRMYKDTFHSDFMGYDPAYSKYSPGMYLIMTIIEKLSDSSAVGRPTIIDFGLGDAQYKEVLGDLEWQESSVYVFAPSIRGLATSARRTIPAVADLMVKRFLEQTRLLQKVKTTWRGRARHSRSVRGSPPA